MAARYIYLSDELNAKLKEEDNVSGLIQSLLRDYYMTAGANKQELEKVLAKKKEEIKTIVTRENRAVEVIEEQLENITKIELSKEDMIKEHEKAEEKRKEGRQSMFIQILGRRVTDEEYNNFEKMFKAGNTDIYDFSERLKNGA